MTIKNGSSMTGPRTLRVGDVHIDISDEFAKPVYTFGFVKPHAYAHRDEIMADIEQTSVHGGNPLYVLRSKDYHLSRAEAEEHYAVHRERPFFNDLIAMIIEGPIHEFLLVGLDAIPEFRKIVGATDPAKAEPGTLRHKYGEPRKGLAYNAVHGSDGLENFVHEVGLHFGRDELGELFWARVDAYKAWLESLK